MDHVTDTILPGDGWYAVYTTDDGSERWDAVLCWKLTRYKHGALKVTGFVTTEDGRRFRDASSWSNFDRFARP